MLQTRRIPRGLLQQHETGRKGWRVRGFVIG
jgi:hypothetical protein